MPARRSRRAHARSNVYRNVDLKALDKAVSDTGLNSWARKYKLPIPAELSPKRQLAALVLYGEIAPGLESFDLAASFQEYPALKSMFQDVCNDAIDLLAREPTKVLKRERSLRRSLPEHIREFADQSPAAPGAGPLRQEAPRLREGEGQAESEDCQSLRFEKTAILGARAEARNRELLKGFLAIFGLDLIVDFFEEDEEDKSTFGKILDLLIVADWVLAVKRIITLLKRLLARPGLWERLVKKLGRWGAGKLLLGISGKIIPAVLAVLLVVNWVLIWKEWKQREAEFEKRFKEIYDASNCPNKRQLFIDNGHLPT